MKAIAAFDQSKKIARSDSLHAVLLLSIACAISTSCNTLRNHGPLAKGTRLARQLSDRGLEAIHFGDWSKAEKHFQDALRHCPKDRFVREQYANCLRQRGDSSGAILQLQKAIELSEDMDADLIVELGGVYAATGLHDQAAKQVERALRVDPTNPRAWQLKGNLQRDVKQYRAALASFHRALSYEPESTELQIAASETYFELGRPVRTLASLDRLVQQDRSQELPPKVFHLRGLAFDQIGRHDEAVEQLALARDRSSFPSTQILYDLATSQMKAGQFAEAEVSANEASKIATPDQRSQIESLQIEIAKLQPKVELLR